MDLSDAIKKVLPLLAQHGSIKNVQILTLIDGDEDLLELVRNRLIFEGLALDYFGMGLNCGRQLSDGELAKMTEELAKTTEIQVEPNESWFARTFDRTFGPLSLAELKNQIRRQSFPSDAVFRQEGGSWHRIDGFAELAAPIASSSSNHPSRSSPEALNRAAIIGATGSSPPGIIVSPQAVEGCYTWESGVEVGPLQFSDLLKRVSEGRLLGDQFVRVGLNGEWRSANKIPGLFPENASFTKTTASPRCASTTTVVASAVVDSQGSPQVAGESARGSDRNVPALRNPRIKYWTHESTETKGSFQDRLRSVRQHLGWLLAICAAAATWCIWPLSESSIREQYEQVWEEVKLLRAGHTLDAEWTKIQRDSIQQVSGLVRRLQRSSTSAHPVRQELLWAGRCLLKVLQDPRRGEAAGFEAEYLKHMEHVASLQAGVSRVDAMAQDTPAQTGDAANKVPSSKVPPGVPGYQQIPDPRARH